MSLEAALIAYLAAASLLTVTPGLDTAIVLRTAAVEGPLRAAMAALQVYGSFGPAPESPLAEAHTALVAYIVLAGLAGLVDRFWAVAWAIVGSIVTIVVYGATYLGIMIVARVPEATAFPRRLLRRR